jgi:hypothetical protein
LKKNSKNFYQKNKPARVRVERKRKRENSEANIFGNKTKKGFDKTEFGSSALLPVV